MVLYFIVVLILLIVFMLYLLKLIYPIVLQFFLNIILLWVVYARGGVEVLRDKKYKEYAIAVTIALFIFLIFFKPINEFAATINVWWETLLLFSTVLIAQLIQYTFRGEKKKEIVKKIKKAEPYVMIRAYCVKCRAKRYMKNPKIRIMKNKKESVIGFCPICSSKMSKILPKKKPIIIKPVKIKSKISERDKIRLRY